LKGTLLLTSLRISRLSNQSSSSPSLDTSSTELPQISIVPIPQSSLVLPAVSVAPASSANNNGQPQSQSLTLVPTISTQIPDAISSGSSPLNSAVATIGLNVTSSNPPSLATTMADCSETVQAGNNSDTFPSISSSLSPTPVPLSSAADSQTTFPLVSNTVPATSSTAVPAAPSSAAAASNSAEAPNTMTGTSQPTSSIVLITITRSHTVTMPPSSASATQPALTLPSVLTTNPLSATMTITVPAVGTSTASGGQLSIVPINPQSAPAGDGNTMGGPTATVTVTVGMMTTTTTAYFVSESQGPTGGTAGSGRGGG